MTIGTDASIWFFGAQEDKVSVVSTALVLANEFSVAADVDPWANVDDAPNGAAVLNYTFTATWPVQGSIGLYARLLNVEATDDEPVPVTDEWENHLVGVFPIRFLGTPATTYSTTIPLFQMPSVLTQQGIEWYIKNDNTGQTLTAGWDLWVRNKALGPHG